MSVQFSEAVGSILTNLHVQNHGVLNKPPNEGYHGTTTCIVTRLAIVAGINGKGNLYFLFRSLEKKKQLQATFFLVLGSVCPTAPTGFFPER